jgi:drug/metabolite transporter (DMT)-like permease
MESKGEKTMQKRWAADLTLTGIAFVWGITFVLVQDAIATLPPFHFLTIRFAMAAFFLFMYLIYRKPGNLSSSDRKRNWTAGALLGLFLFLGYALQTFSLIYTTSGKSGFLTGTSVAMVPVFALVVLREKMKFSSVIGVLLALCGLYLLAFTDFNSVNYGDVLAFLCAIFFALQIVYTGKYTGSTSMMHLVTIQLATVAGLSGMCAIVTEPRPLFADVKLLLAPAVILALVFTSLFCTLLAFIAQTHVQKHTSPTRVALIFSLEPVFAALGDYFWNDIALTGRSFLGCLFIFAGMILSELPSSSLSFLKKKEGKNLKRNR